MVFLLGDNRMSVSVDTIVIECVECEKSTLHEVTSILWGCQTVLLECKCGKEWPMKFSDYRAVLCGV